MAAALAAHLDRCSGPLRITNGRRLRAHLSAIQIANDQPHRTVLGAGPVDHVS
jgi:hypothetical protein